MFSSAAFLLAATALGIPGIDNGTQITFRGNFVAVKGEAAQTRKSFDLSLLAAESNDDGLALYWTLEERGRGAFAWPDRLGVWRLDAQGRASGESGPALLYDRGEGISVVPLNSLVLTRDKPLAKGQAWSEGKLEHLVAGEERAAGRDCWRIEVRNQYGPKRILWVDKERPLVAALSETVFIGQGEQFDLRIELTSADPLAPTPLEKTLTGFDALLKLHERLARAPRSLRNEWTDAQFKLLKAELPADLGLPAESPLAAVFQAARADVNDQKGRSSAVAALREKIVGAEPGEFKLEDLASKTHTRESLKGHVTVLHFWDYKDSPLAEPYGQTGYLDFLYRQKKAAGVQVYGVAVNQGLAEPAERRGILGGIRRFQSFMNLSYPILLDDGSALKQFGDPRPTGAKLPVFIVLDTSGKVLLYQVGHFEVNRDRGLEELAGVIAKALSK